MAIMTPHVQQLGQKLCAALGLPKNVRWFELRVACDEAVTVKCEYFPESNEGNPLEAVFAEYQLVEKRVEQLPETNRPFPAVPPSPFGRRVRSEMPPPPPPPPLSRYVREDARPFDHCPKCGSSMVRKWWIFGQLKCIHPECGYVKESFSGSGYLPRRADHPYPPPRKP